MTRTGWIRLGSTFLALALVATPSRAAMIRLDVAATPLLDADAPPAWRELARDPLDLEGALAGRLAGGVRPLNAYYSGSCLDWNHGLVLLDWTTSDFSEIRPRPMVSVGDGSASFSTSVEGPSPEPPLTLAGFLGVAAWAVFRRRAERRPRRPIRRPTPVRATGTAIVPARRLGAERSLVLPARFVVVSTATFPACRAETGTKAVGVRRRGHARRISKMNALPPSRGKTDREAVR